MMVNEHKCVCKITFIFDYFLLQISYLIKSLAIFIYLNELARRTFIVAKGGEYESARHWESWYNEQYKVLMVIRQQKRLPWAEGSSERDKDLTIRDGF